VLEIARIARDGVLGRVHGLRTLRVQPGNRHEEDAVWVLTPHDLVIALEILGEVPRPHAAAGVWNGDHLVTMHALLESSAGWHACEVSERAPSTERRVELHCEDGVAVLADGWADHVLLHRPNGGAPERVEAAGELPLLAELRAFLGFVAGGTPPKSSAAEGAAVVKAIAELRALAA
jgi:predicted dehydrogenase